MRRASPIRTLKPACWSICHCSSGGWIDLGPYLKQSRVDVSQFPRASRYYTQYNGVRCALPFACPSGIDHATETIVEKIFLQEHPGFHFDHIGPAGPSYWKSARDA